MNLNVDSWKEFRLGDLFSEMYKAEAHVKGELECDDVPLDNTIRFVSRTEMNNGCDCYVLNNGLSGIEKANAIAIGDTTATCFYQGEDFVCGDHMVICRADWINLHTALFIISIINNCKTKIVLNLEDEEAQRVQSILHLSEAEVMEITHFERGNGLISTNNNNITVEFRCSDLEKSLITTDRRELQELVEQKKR